MAATHVAELVETAPGLCSFKVHCLMCTELMRLVDRTSSLLPEIDTETPRSSTGLHALNLLNSAIQKAKLLLQNCTESSKLYLAVTGDAVVASFKRSTSSLEEGLRGIQFMVPVALALEISLLIDDLSATTFILDPHEDEAGKAIRDLLQKANSTADSMENPEVKALQLAASRLNMTSPKSVLIEKRSIKKLLHKVDENDSTKKKILTYFLHLFKKYGNYIIQDEIESSSACGQVSAAFENSRDVSANNQPGEAEPNIGCRQHEVESKILEQVVPPKGFRCPLSSRLMYDPVVIDSGKTYERMWIQRWLDECHDTCPITKMKVNRNNLRPNTRVKALISMWCAWYKVEISDPSMEPDELHRCETYFASKSCFDNSRNDSQVDFGNISLGSVDAHCGSDNSLFTKIEEDSVSTIPVDDGSDSDQSHANMSETELKFLSNLGELSWESQCKVVEDVQNHLKYNDKARHSLSSENFVEPLVAFLRHARDSNDIKAQRDGFQLLLTFVKENRIGVLYLDEDAFGLLASFLDSEVTAEVFTVTEILSGYPGCRSKIVECGALTFVLRALISQTDDFKEQALNILCNLSLNRGICSQIASLGCVEMLVGLLSHETFARKCLLVIKNLCIIEEARAAVAETNTCLPSIATVLDCGSFKEQEHAIYILLSLCSQRTKYCQLVLDEGVVPSLVHISINGSGRGKVSAVELLRLLRDVQFKPADRGSRNHTSEKKSSKVSRFFRRKIQMF